MFDNYIIEIDDKAAGILVKSDHVFAFHALEHSCRELEGMLFPDAIAAERAARKVVKRGMPLRSSLGEG